MELIDGTQGELTVIVDGQMVAQKGASMPGLDEVLAAVRKTAAAATV